MTANYNKSDNPSDKILGIRVLALLFFIFILLIQIADRYRIHGINMDTHCNYLAEMLKANTSYGNNGGIKRFFEENNSLASNSPFFNFQLAYWQVSSGSETLAQSIPRESNWLKKVLTTKHSCSIQDVRNLSPTSPYRLDINTTFRVAEMQLQWSLLISLLLSGIPLLVYSRIRKERIQEKNLLLNFFSNIAKRDQRKINSKALRKNSITNILHNQGESIIRFVDETHDLNNHIDPEYIASLEKNFIDLEERNARLAIQSKELSKQTTLKSSFFANLSHDFRTPLYTIDGYSRLLLSTELEKRQLSHVNAIQSANTNLLQLVSNFLSMSRLEAGKIDLDYGALDLCTLLDEITTGLSFLTHQQGNHFFIDICDNFPKHIETDVIKFRQILANLLSNAIKYTQNGLVYIRLNHRNLGKDTGAISLTISDTGKGISEKDLKTIFDPYTRLSRDQNKIHGTGLGLGICKELCEIIGAKLSVTSEENIGSTFSIDLTTKIIKQEQNNSYRFKSAFYTLHIFNSVKPMDTYLTEWLSPLDIKVIQRNWESLSSETLEKIDQSDRVLIILDYPKVTELTRWAKNYSKYASNIIICTPTDSLDTEQLKILENFVVVTNNLSNYDLSESMNQKESSQTATFEQLQINPLQDYVLLLAEDNDLNRKIIEEKLTSYGAQVISCPDGMAALELYKARNYSAILMDAHMPKLNGTELTKMIRHEFSDHSTPIIGITASTSSVEYQYFIQSGMSDCLIKPLQDKELITTIKKLAKPIESTKKRIPISNKVSGKHSQNSTQERINKLSVKSLNTHVQKLDEILLQKTTPEKQEKLFHELHKLKGTLSMTSFKALHLEVSEIENLINPMLWLQTEHSKTENSERIILVEQKFLRIRPDLLEKSSNEISSND